MTSGLASLLELGQLGLAATAVWLGTWSDPAARARLARERLDALVRHARLHSPFYARLYRGIAAGRMPSLVELPW